MQKLWSYTNRMPKVYARQRVSFLNDAVRHLPDGPGQQARDKAMSPKLTGEQYVRSPKIHGNSAILLEVYGYNAERHARIEIVMVFQEREPADSPTGITKPLDDKYMKWFRPTQKRAPL